MQSVCAAAWKYFFNTKFKWNILDTGIVCFFIDFKKDGINLEKINVKFKLFF